MLARLGLLALIALSPAAAHELEENRASLVLRDKTHISVTLYVAWADALHLMLAPQRPMAEFLAVYSAMSVDDLQKQLTRAEQKVQAGTRLMLASGQDGQLTNWIFPEPRRVQSLLQQRIMQAMVDPNGHAHEEPLEIRAEVVAQSEITSVRIQFPEEFRKVLVVAYRPSQTWVEPKALSPSIRF